MSRSCSCFSRSHNAQGVCQSASHSCDCTCVNTRHPDRNLDRCAGKRHISLHPNVSILRSHSNPITNRCVALWPRQIEAHFFSESSSFALSLDSKLFNHLLDPRQFMKQWKKKGSIQGKSKTQPSPSVVFEEPDRSLFIITPDGDAEIRFLSPFV